jgi:type III restriction enzyme
LKIRKNSKGKKRELFIVYDEGHNLSNQQTKLLLDLEPAAFLLASGTIQLPSKINEEFQIPLDKKLLKKKKLILKIPTSAVSQNELIKGVLHIHGYESSMEATVTKMVEHLIKLSCLTEEMGLEKPKAIYICKTNMREEKSFLPDTPNKPFLQRKAPPILIWRHLVEKCRIEPGKIAVCCSLKFTKQFPKDDNFIFFPKLKNEKQYKEFIEGKFEHIIFNKSLQEG